MNRNSWITWITGPLYSFGVIAFLLAITQWGADDRLARADCGLARYTDSVICGPADHSFSMACVLAGLLFIGLGVGITAMSRAAR